ncbi:ATP-dependent DNA helicase UvrD2 [Ornithinicoccus halotolerans]|uniref:ATP-dependent DNA helicase UvrD2 n=1 Tax=Ornithinicoccus halotolerans TaxID=1748220 RepID=UPI0018863801|nr:ATP-dependent DNA helicase UvrD2 [Ornithinicoccus halotolerans]
MTVTGEPARVLAALDPEQRLVAEQPRGPMCVLAGAGTGKTRAITHRIAYGVHTGAYTPGRVLAVTFTARAAGEMRTRLRQLGVPGVSARTFHSAALRQLQYFWPQAVGGPPPDVVGQKVPVVAEAAGRLQLRLDRTELRDLASEIEWAKVGMLTVEAYRERAGAEQRRPGGLDPMVAARVLEVYEEVKTERHVIDFEDVLLLTVGILAENPSIAERVRDQYRHFVVDEYQDVNPVQQALLDLWVGDRADLCVVGDPAQTIYSFTGASPEHLLGFTTRRPDAQVVRLVRNYRSTPQVVQLANAVIATAPRQAGVELQAQAGAGPQPRLVSYDTDEAEAAGVAAEVTRLLSEGVPASEMAVLFRTNAQSAVLEQALAEAGVPYLVRGGERFFSRAEVRQGVLLLRGAARTDDGSRPLPELVQDVLAGAGWTPQPPSSGGATRERWESLQALVLLAEDLAQDAAARLPALVAELDRRAAEQHAPTVQGVTLASLHAAKGLEWDAVFLIGCSEGLIPISIAEGPARLEEERRLLYVGLTRGRRHLVLSWAGSRGGSSRATRRPSRFLAAAPVARLLGAAPGSVRPSGRNRAPKPRAARVCRSCGNELASAAERKVGRCQDCPPTYDEATFEALRGWRSATAREAGVPAFVVFTDATLTAIAEQRPGSPEELARVPGVGPVKRERYGTEVLDILAGHTATGRP